MSHYYNKNLDDTVMEGSIEKSHFNNKSHYYNVHSADWGIWYYNFSLYLQRV